MNLKKHKGKILVSVKIAVSLVIVLSILISLVKIRQNDKRLAAEESKPQEEFSMELPDTDLGEEGFKIAASNKKYSLLANIPTGEIAISDNLSGDIWYSNPQDRKEDKSAVMATRSSSQLVVKFTDMESGNDLTVDSYMGSVLRKGLDFKLTKNGIKFIYRYPNHGIVIPIEYTLFEDGFEAKIIADEIEEHDGEEYKIISISLLPFFAAGGVNDSGYMFVPDGSGALISYNNGKTNCAEYSEAIYGSDILITDSKSYEITEKVRMPVFGNKTGNLGFLGIVTSGEASGRINSAISGVTTGYNQIYPSIEYRNVFITEIEKHGSKRQLKQYGCCSLAGTDFTVRYYPLKGDTADYSGMAGCYRNYLKEKGMLSGKQGGKNALALEIYGAIRTEKNIVGVKRDVVTPLSDYGQVYNLCKLLLNDGVTNFELLYKGWNEGGLKAPTAVSVAPEKKLGGKKKLSKLLDFADKNNIRLYLDCDLTGLYKNGNGFSHVSDAAKLLTQDPARLFEFKYASSDVNTEISRYLIKPSLFEKSAEKLSKSAEKFGVKGIADTGFAEALYSDYSKKELSLRYRTQTLTEKALNIFKSKVKNVAVTGGNVYAVSDADAVFDIPTDSSGFDIADKTVPFYSMVLHGYTELATEAVNSSEDPEIARLKAIETGCLPKYTFIYGDTSVLIGTEYSNLFNVQIEDWYETVVANYKRDKELYGRIGGLEIRKHTEIQENVYSTEYEDGTVVLVNYGDKSVNVNGTLISALGYAVN